ncbi:uncharacterized protein LOC131334379 [Rhododendron vialii]|uniref:uncharacterized protein LOC131334379 n=1 Tax=Rhododendron vialii TaxID=182163 RepID=UPI00265EDCCD|nr:uncharacterized protein LOC131334379 [Rhododendron vialii]XP_058225339.1 uncharacterized protein LOC131334379 [Rhododendron vialii]
MDTSSKPTSRVISSAYPYPKDLKVEELVPDKLQSNLSNYVVWKKQMLDDVIAHSGLLGFIDGTVRCPPETHPVIAGNVPNAGGTIHKSSIESKPPKQGSTGHTREKNKRLPRYVAWKRTDELVRKWIMSRLAKSIKNKLGRFETAKELWKAFLQLVEDMEMAERKKRMNSYGSLYKATIEGDWEAADKFLEKEPNAVTARITFGSETPLIVAVKVKVASRMRFAEKLVERMSPDDLALSDHKGRTALHRAAGAGNIEVAKLLVGKNSRLPYLETHVKDMPLFYAAGRGDKEMVRFLMHAMDLKRLKGEPGFRVLFQLTINQLYDIALEVLQNNPALASFIPKKEEDLKFHALTALADKPSSFESGNNYNFLKRFIYSRMEPEDIADYRRRDLDIEAPTSNNFVADNGGWGYAVKKRLHGMFWKVAGKIDITGRLIEPIREKKLLHSQALELLRYLCEQAIKLDFSNASRIFRLPLEQATSVGIHEIVEEILRLHPYAVSLENHKKQLIFQQAIVYRQEKVFNIIYQLKEYSAIVLSKWDTDDNNALHLAGYVAPPQLLYRRAGAALQMQRELQWFKEVETLVLSKTKEERNKEEKTPAQVFSDTHKELVKEGERWMKDNASSCTIIASLIATVVFAAAIQVPGGNNDNGLPIFNQEGAFIIFGIANALALFSSISSVIMFLSILTSPCAERDFLFSLPHKLIIGLITLFLSILFTMAAFGATLYLVFGGNKGWILIPVVALGCLPVTLFGALQFPLLVEMMKSTYSSSIFDKRTGRLLL